MNRESRLSAEPWRVTAVTMALICAVLLVIDSSTSDALILTLSFALLYIAGAFFVGRNSRIGLVLLAALFAIDSTFVLFYERSSLRDWVFQGFYALSNVLGLIAAIMVLLKRRRSST
jgi:hypothetical protein